MKQLAGFNSFLGAFFHVDLHRPSRYKHIYGTTDTTSEAYNTGANQVGEMFANYNLIAAIASFLLPLLANIRVENSHFVALACGGLGLMSVYFITEPPYSLWNGFNGWCWYRLGKYLSIPYAMLSGSCHLTKWAITWGFQLLYRNPS
jgi:maltose/moltooligosaccharide transporter